MRRKSTDIVQLKLRFPEALRRNLSQAAKGKRSMNAEIVSRLDESFLRGNLAALMREHIDNAVTVAGTAAATKAVEQVVQLMREHIDTASTAAATKVAEQVVQQLRNRDSGNDKAS
jgi:hypothetical protein